MEFADALKMQKPIRKTQSLQSSERIKKNLTKKLSDWMKP